MLPKMSITRDGRAVLQRGTAVRDPGGDVIVTTKRIAMNLKKKLLFSGVIFLISFVFLEIGLRLVFQFSGVEALQDWKILDEELSYRNRPGFQTDQYRINSYGLRGEEITIEKPVGTKRIIAVGNSCVFCVGASSTEMTFEEQLERRLAANGESIEVINGGVKGYASGHVLGFFKKYLLPLDPDVVIWYVGWNNMQVYHSPLQNLGRPSLLRRMARKISKYSYTVLIVKNSIANLIAKKSVKKIKGEEVKKDNSSARNRLRQSLELYRKDTDEMIRICREKGIKLLLVTLPTVITPDAPEDEFQRMIGRWGFSRELVLNFLDEINNFLRERASAREGVWIVDANRKFSGIKYEELKQLFGDYMHPNDKGYELLTDLLFQTISEERLLHH